MTAISGSSCLCVTSIASSFHWICRCDISLRSQSPWRSDNIAKAKACSESNQHTRKQHGPPSCMEGTPFSSLEGVIQMILVEGNQRAHLHFTVVFTCGLDESSVAETLVFHAIDHNYGEGIFCKLSLAANLMFSHQSVYSWFCVKRSQREVGRFTLAKVAFTVRKVEFCQIQLGETLKGAKTSDFVKNIKIVPKSFEICGLLPWWIRSM